MARDPKAEVEISAHSRNLGAKLREARSKFATFGSELKKNVFGKDLVSGGFWGKGGAQLVGNLGTSAAGGALGFLGDQAKAAYEFRDSLVRLKIAGNATGEEIHDLESKIRDASNETGIGKQAIVGAARQYVALTGDIRGASASIETWTRVAQASDTAIGDVASTAQAMRDNLKIDPTDMAAAFDVLIGQGKSGAIEMKDLASQLAIVSPLMAQFGGGTGVKGLRDLGATIQVVRKGFGGAEETITGVQSLMTAVIKNAKHFQAAGVSVFNVDPKTGTKTLKSFREIIDAIGTSRLMKDPTKLEKAFGRVEAFRAFLQLKDNKQALDELADSTEYAGTTQRDLNTYSQSAAGKVAIAWERAKNAIGDIFTEERIKEFASALESAIDAFKKFVDYAKGAYDTMLKIYHLIHGESPEERAEKIIKNVLRSEAAEDRERQGWDANTRRGDEIMGGRKSRLDNYRALSQKEFANVGRLSNKENLSDEEKRDLMVSQKLSQLYLDKSDPWGAGEGGETKTSVPDFAKGYDPSVLKHMSKDEFAKTQQSAAGQDVARALLREIVGMRSDLQKNLKQPPALHVDGAKVSHAVRNAGGIQVAGSTRPGG